MSVNIHDRIEYARQQLDNHNIEYTLKKRDHRALSLSKKVRR